MGSGAGVAGVAIAALALISQMSAARKSLPLGKTNSLRVAHQIQLGEDGDSLAPTLSVDHSQSNVSSRVGEEGTSEFRDTSIFSSLSQRAVPAPRQLPRDIAHFTGRARDIAALDKLAAAPVSDNPATVIVSAIAGTAGVGKTALALHWAHRVRSRFPDGDLYVNLQGYGPGDPLSPMEVLESFLMAMNVPPERILRDLDMRAAMFRTVLSRRRILIVLDNANSAEQVRPLLPGSPGCLVIITSRSMLSGLIALDGAGRIILDMLSPDEATALLCGILGNDRVIAEPEAVASIIRNCGCLPLALRIVAENAAAHPRRLLAELAQELAEEATRLDFLNTGDDTAAVRSVFSWSYRALRPELAKSFRLLGLHAGPDISVEAAAALMGMTSVSARRVMDEIAVVHLIEEPIESRYRFHDLIRSYAVECAFADEHEATRTEAVSRVLAWYLHKASFAGSIDERPNSFKLPESLEPASGSIAGFSDHKRAIGWLDAELSNIVAAAKQAVEYARYDIASWLPVVLQPYFRLRTPFGPGLDIHFIGLEAAQMTDDFRAAAELRRGIGVSFFYRGQFEESLTYQREALGDYRRLGWEGEILLVNIGSCCAALGRYEESFDYLHRALVISRRTGNKNAEGFALQSLGWTCLRLEMFQQSTVYCRESVTVFREIDSRVGLSIALSRLAYSRLRLQDFPNAIDFLWQALEIARGMDDQPILAWILESLGTSMHEVGRKDKAREFWQEALAMYERLLNDTGIVRMQTVLMNHGISPPDPGPFT